MEPKWASSDCLWVQPGGDNKTKQVLNIRVVFQKLKTWFQCKKHAQPPNCNRNPGPTIICLVYLYRPGNCYIWCNTCCLVVACGTGVGGLDLWPTSLRKLAHKSSAFFFFFSSSSSFLGLGVENSLSSPCSTFWSSTLHSCSVSSNFSPPFFLFLWGLTSAVGK